MPGGGEQLPGWFVVCTATSCSCSRGQPPHLCAMVWCDMVAVLNSYFVIQVPGDSEGGRLLCPTRSPPAHACIFLFYMLRPSNGLNFDYTNCKRYGMVWTHHQCRRNERAPLVIAAPTPLTCDVCPSDGQLPQTGSVARNSLRS